MRFDLDTFIQELIDEWRASAESDYDQAVEQRVSDYNASVPLPLEELELDLLNTNYDLSVDAVQLAQTDYDDAVAALARYDDITALRTELAN